MQKFKKLFIPHRLNGYRPEAIRSRGLIVFAIYIFTFQIIFNFQSSGQFSVLGYASDINTHDLLTISNDERTKANLPSYANTVKLSLAAQAKAEHMIANDYWAHYAPDGTSPWDFINAQNYTYVRAGENLAYGFASSAGVVAGWMNSPTHKANVLDQGFTQVGFGIANGVFQGNENTVIVAMYGEPIHTIAAPKTIVSTSSSSLTSSTPVTLIKSESTIAEAPIAPEPITTTPIIINTTAVEEDPVNDINNHRLLARLADDGGIVVTGETTAINVGSGDISNFSALFSGQASWSFYMVTGGMLAMAMIYFIRHIQSLLQIAIHGEHFVIGHPTLEASIVYMAIWLIMFATYGSVL